MPPRFRRTSRDAPNSPLTGWPRPSLREVDVEVREHLEDEVQVGKGTACCLGAYVATHRRRSQRRAFYQSDVMHELVNSRILHLTASGPRQRFRGRNENDMSPHFGYPIRDEDQALFGLRA